MPSMLSRLVTGAAICLATCSAATASPYIATFTMGGFLSSSPVETVSGTIRWEADSLFGPIHQITAIDLTILGHAYSVDEVHVVTQTSLPGSFPWNTVTISGVLNDTETGSAIYSETDDFWLRWHRDTNEWIDFHYATSGVVGIWGASQWDQPQVSQLDIAPALVPEPATWTMLMAALLVFGGQRVTRSKGMPK